MNIVRVLNFTLWLTITEYGAFLWLGTKQNKKKLSWLIWIKPPNIMQSMSCFLYPEPLLSWNWYLNLNYNHLNSTECISFITFLLTAKPRAWRHLTVRTLKKALYCIHVAVLGEGSGKVSNFIHYFSTDCQTSEPGGI